MTILIVGTSNTLVRGGWFDSFSEGVGYPTTRMALGGAPFLQFFPILAQIREAKPRQIVVECAANDEAYAQQVGNELFFDRLYQMFLSSLRRIAPVTVLRIPPESFLMNMPDVARRQRTISAEMGCDFYDSAPDLLEIAQGEPPYRDKYHPTTLIANALGQRFAAFMRRKIGRVEETSRPNLLSYEDSVFEREVPVSGDETTRIETSLLREEFRLLKPGQSVNFNRNIFALGLFVDSGETTGVLRLEGGGETRNIFCYYTDPSNRNVKRFIPFRNGMHVRKLSCVYPHTIIDIALHTDLFYIPQKLALGRLICLDMKRLP